MFKGRRLLIATKHQKEKVIAPLFAESLDLKCFVSEKFDTDTLGTFTGEVERMDDPVTTVRKKCMKAMEIYHCDLGIASEGSFGPHPTLPFLTAHEEILIFIDKQHDLEIIVKELSTETNFNREEVETEDQLIRFAESVLFPSHALILCRTKTDKTQIIKGISDWDQLKKSFHHLLERHGSVCVETDMRAMYNPSRMKVIRRTAQKLIEKVRSCCPQCNTPGFGVSEAKAGLPCKWCNSPTRSTLSHIFKCQKCGFTKEVPYPHKRTTEDPMYCNVCNP
jgi:hypothetical protein